MIDLFLVSWNRPKMTELVIKTINRNTKAGTFRLTVIDNGSDTNMQSHLLKLKRETNLIHSLILWDINNGLEKARQESLHFASEKFFVSIDNDCLPQKGWLEGLEALMERYEDYAAISLRTQVMIGTGNIFEDESPDVTEFPHPGGSFRIMRTSDVSKVGGWDRESIGRGSEERFICGKLREAGYKTGFATNLYCLHLFGTRDKDKTDRWGYPKEWLPSQSGHSDVWHPALNNGDQFEDVAGFAGKKLAEEYFA